MPHLVVRRRKELLRGIQRWYMETLWNQCDRTPSNKYCSNMIKLERENYACHFTGTHTCVTKDVHTSNYMNNTNTHSALQCSPAHHLAYTTHTKSCSEQRGQETHSGLWCKRQSPYITPIGLTLLVGIVTRLISRGSHVPMLRLSFKPLNTSTCAFFTVQSHFWQPMWCLCPLCPF